MKIISISNHETRRGGYYKTMEVELNGQRATISFSNRGWDNGYRQRKRKSRLSVYGKTVESLAENFVNRTRRPYKVYREAAKPFLEALGLPTKGIVWNQYAFCTCPCSPAFIMPAPIVRNVGFSKYGPREEIVDIDITIHEELPTVDESIEMDMNRVDAFGRWAGFGSELVTA
jgi:hypothetical protein